MPRETVADKATRLFEADAVVYVGTVDEGPPPVYEFTVKGDNGDYGVLASGPGDVSCDCPAKNGCAHAGAVALWLEDKATRQGTLDVGPLTAVETPQDDVLEGEVVDDPEPPNRAATEAQIRLTQTDPLARDRATWNSLAQVKNEDFIPKGYRGRPAAMFAAVKMGEEYGLGPFESLRLIDVVEGAAEPNAELKLRLFRRAGHRIVASELDPRSCTVTGERGDTGEQLTVSYTVEDAERGGMVKITPEGEVRARSAKGYALPWETYTEDLLWARAVSRLVRRLAPDALDRT